MTKSTKDSFDWDRFFESVDLEYLATAPGFVIDEEAIPIITEEDLTAQEESLYHCIINKGPVVLITEYGTLKIIPEKGKMAGEVLTQASIDFADEVKKMFHNQKGSMKYADNVVNGYYKLWERYYRHSPLSDRKLAEHMMEELPTTMKVSTLAKWITDWRVGRRLPR